MIIHNPNINKENYISFDEATGLEVAKYIEKDEVPDSFQKIAYRLLDSIENETKAKITGGANDKLQDALNIFSSNVRKNINSSGKDARSYTFSIPQKIKISLFKIPKEYVEFADKVFSKAGLKKGQSIADGTLGNYYYKKDKTKKGEDCYFRGFLYANKISGVLATKAVIVLQCIECNAETKSFIEGATVVSSNGFEYDTDDMKPNDTGFEGMSPEELYGFCQDQRLTSSDFLSSDSEYSDFFRDPKVMSSFTEYMDLSNSKTRKTILNMNEAEQSSALTALTSKLYDNIVTKVDDIDYGDIPSTKGDITKLSNYDKLRECIELLRNILIEFKQDTKPIDVIGESMGNIMSRKDLFSRAFRLNVELPIIMYNNTVLSIISAVSYMIATSIEFMKTPNRDSFQITLDKVSYTKTKSNMLYENLKKFNKSCSSGDFDKAMEHILQNRINKFGESAVVLGTFSVISGVLLILNIIPILREMVFFFYYTRMRVSEFFDIQADLLQMNAYNIQNNENINNEEKERIVSKQLKIVELFRKIANKISFTGKRAEVETTKEITNNNNKMKLEDISDEMPNNVSALF